MIALSCGQIVPVWYPIGLKPRSCRERAHAPAAEEILRHELVGNRASALLRHDPRPQEMPEVRRERVDRLVRVEPDDVIAASLVRPEVAVEAGEELLGLERETACEAGVAHHPLGELGDTQLRIVDVAPGSPPLRSVVRDPPVAELDAVPRVLPALVPRPSDERVPYST